MDDRLISLNAALDALIFDFRPSRQKGKLPVSQYAKTVYDRIKALPSAQPNTCDGYKWDGAIGYGECHHCKRAFSDMYEDGESV